jgi:4-hydroxybenzoyl-CoA reductase subunit beta
MHLPPFKYTAPKTVAKGVSAQKTSGKFLAGGTDLFVAMKDRAVAPDMLVDLSGISGLKGVKRDTRTKELRIGAMTTLTKVQENLLIQKHLPDLSQSISLVSTMQLRNMGTLGGNLCLDTRCTYYNQPSILKKRWEPCLKLGGKICHVVKGKNTCYAVYSGDMAPLLIAAGARIRVAGTRGVSETDLAGFFSGSGIKPNIIEFNEILTEVRLPPLPENSGLSYQKLRLRDTIDFPLLGVAVFLQLDPKDKICRDIRLVLGAIGPAPMVVTEAQERMRGRRLTARLIDEISTVAQKMAHPVDNTASSPRYRKMMLRILIKKAFDEILKRIKHGKQAA